MSGQRICVSDMSSSVLIVEGLQRALNELVSVRTINALLGAPRNMNQVNAYVWRADGKQKVARAGLLVEPSRAESSTVSLDIFAQGGQLAGTFVPRGLVQRLYLRVDNTRYLARFVLNGSGRAYCGVLNVPTMSLLANPQVTVGIEL